MANKTIIAELLGQLAYYRRDNSELLRIIYESLAQNIIKDYKIDMLTDEVERKDHIIAELNSEIEVNNEIIKKKDGVITNLRDSMRDYYDYTPMDTIEAAIKDYMDSRECY